MLIYDTVWVLPRKILRKKRVNPGEVLFDVLALEGEILPHRVRDYLGRGREVVEWFIPEDAREVYRVVYSRSENGVVNMVRVYRCKVERREGSELASLRCVPVYEQRLAKRELLGLDDVVELAKSSSRVGL